MVHNGFLLAVTTGQFLENKNKRFHYDIHIKVFSRLNFISKSSTTCIEIGYTDCMEEDIYPKCD